MSFRDTLFLCIESINGSFECMFDFKVSQEFVTFEIRTLLKIFYFNFLSHCEMSEALHSLSRICWVHFTLTNKNRQNIPAAAADWWRMVRKHSHTFKVLANTIFFYKYSLYCFTCSQLFIQWNKVRITITFSFFWCFIFFSQINTIGWTTNDGKICKKNNFANGDYFFNRKLTKRDN